MGNKGTYTYLSWIRKGMASQIQEEDKLGGAGVAAYDNASVSININVKSGSDKLGSDNREFALLGPGDITVKAIASSEAHTEPLRGLHNVEYNNLPYMQFYDEDFPWRFSPAKDKGGKLRPWLQLIALTEDEFSSSGINSKNYAQIQINAGVPVPKHTEAYLWSHVQIDHSLEDYAESFSSKSEAIQSMMQNDPNSITSRILCPRKLAPNTHYFVFLIPAFERGRLAGLGQDISAAGIQDYAIQETVTTKKYDFPTYYSWDFHTSDGGGDFEELSRKLKKVESDSLESDGRSIGSMSFSALDIGDGLHYTGSLFGEEGELNLFGALIQPSANPKSIIRSKNKKVTDFTTDLKNYLNMPLANVDDSGESFSEEIDNLEDDPIISAPMYGSWHSQKFSVDNKKTTGWQNEINLDPGNRIVAGLGAELFRENQDEMMKTAWEQYGEIREANRKINQAAFLEMTNKKLFNKYLKHSTQERIIGTSSLLHGRIKFGSVSVKEHLETSSTPSGSFTKAFQNSTRNGSSLLKSMAARNSAVTKSELSSAVYKNKAVLPNTITLAKSAMVVSESDLTASIDKTLKSTSKLSTFSIAPNASSLVKKKEQTAVKSALRTLKTQIGTSAVAQPTAPTAKFSNLKTIISRELLPQTTLLSKLNGVINLPNGTLNKMDPVMAYPKINVPIHSLLLEKHLELFIPQLDLLENNSITILAANQQYIESLMLGFNSEMARELVWRDYPTDQRGSYARIFWDSINMKNEKDKSLEDIANDYGHIKEIHTWNGSHGTNQNPENDLSEMTVVVVRGELLRKYPNTLIYFQEAKWKNPRTKKIRELNDSKESKLPEFSAKLTSDIHILGFALKPEDAQSANDGLGSFLVLQEPPAENKFGMDISSSEKYESWSDLAWDQFKDTTEYIQVSDFKKTTKTFNGVRWGRNSNHMAYILNQRPFKLGIHAEKLI